MIKLNFSIDTLIDLHILYGEEAVKIYFNILKDEALYQLNIVKPSEAYLKRAEVMHNKLYSMIEDSDSQKDN